MQAESASACTISDQGFLPMNARCADHTYAMTNGGSRSCAQSLRLLITAHGATANNSAAIRPAVGPATLRVNAYVIATASTLSAATKPVATKGLSEAA